MKFIGTASKYKQAMWKKHLWEKFNFLPYNYEKRNMCNFILNSLKVNQNESKNKIHHIIAN